MMNVDLMFESEVLYRENEKIVLDLQKLSEVDLKAIEEFENNTLDFMSRLRDKVKRYLNSEVEISLKNYDNFKFHKNISEIRVEDIGKVVKIDGIISKATKNMARVIAKSWECQSCGTVIKTDGKKEPGRCSCGSKNLKETDIKLEDLQELEIEEMQDNLEGKQPEKIRVRLTNNLTHSGFDKIFQAGNKIEILGVIEKINLPQRKDEELYEYRVFALDFNSLEEQFEEEDIDDETMDKIQKIAEDNPLQKLSDALSPSIYGYDDIKKSLILQMVRGLKKQKSDGTLIRDRIHLMLVGDPGISKSTLAKNVQARTPKSYYVSGDESSKAGLIASAEKDEMTGSWGIKSGAVCKCNGSTCIVDEMDKMDAEDKKGLHTPMELGKAPVSKAGINTELNADSSILSILNPKDGMFDSSGKKTLVDQINLPPALINRFDLVFVMKDDINDKRDENIAQKIISGSDDEIVIDIPTFRKYITYARRFKPEGIKDFEEELAKFYLDLRRKSVKSDSNMRGMPITPRQLQGIIRLAEASAKIRLSDKVDRQDIDIAKQLFYDSLVDLGMDEEGTLDLARMGQGKTVSKKKKREALVDIFRSAIANTGNTVLSNEELQKASEEKGMNINDYYETINQLNQEGSVLKKDGKWELNV